MSEIIGLIIWEAVACIFLVIGISSWRSEDAVGFFNVVAPPKIKANKVKEYNHAVARIWFFFTLVLAILGIPLGFVEQNSKEAGLYVVGVIFGTILLVIIIVVWYLRVEIKYREN